MDGMRISGGEAAGQMPAAAKNPAIEGTPAEESKESPAQKMAELQKSAATKAAPPSPKGVGETVNLLA